MARRRTEAERRREVEEWRVSGASPGAYAAKRGYSETTLRKWIASEDLRPRARSAAPELVQVVARSKARLGDDEIVVEVGAARVRVARAFDPALLRSVVLALSESAR